MKKGGVSRSIEEANIESCILTAERQLGGIQTGKTSLHQKRVLLHRITKYRGSMQMSDIVNRLSVNRLSVNWLSVNRLSVNWLSVNWLSVNWLSVNRLSVNWLSVNRLPVNRLSPPFSLANAGQVRDVERFSGHGVSSHDASRFARPSEQHQVSGGHEMDV